MGRIVVASGKAGWACMALLDHFSSEGPAEIMPLANRTGELAQAADSAVAIYAFGNHWQAERFAELQHCLCDRVLRFMLGHLGDELPVDLNAIKGQCPQAGNGRKAGAEIIESKADTLITKACENSLGQRQIVDNRAFSQLKDQALGRKSGFSQQLDQLLGKPRIPPCF